METTVQGQITSVASTQFGHNVAVSMKNGSIDFFSVNDFSKIGTIQINDATPNSIDFSSNELGKMVAIGLSDGSTSILNLTGNKYTEIKRIKGQKGSILSVAFHPSRKIIAAGSLDGTFAVYSCDSGSEWKETYTTSSPLGVTSVQWGTFSPENPNLMTLFVGGADGVLRVYRSNGQGWEMNASVQVHNGWIRKMATPITSNMLVQKIATCSEDNTAAVVQFVDNSLQVKYLTSCLPVTGVSWAMADKTVVLSHSNGNTSYWNENENGEWVLSE